jgi:hypothetical protein
MNFRETRVIELIGILVVCALVFGCKPRHLTPAKFKQAVEVCRWSGGIPKPIYPDGDPLRVTHVECQKP